MEHAVIRHKLDMMVVLCAFQRRMETQPHPLEKITFLHAAVDEGMVKAYIWRIQSHIHTDNKGHQLFSVLVVTSELRHAFQRTIGFNNSIPHLRAALPHMDIFPLRTNAAALQ